MPHVNDIAKRKEILTIRANIIRAMREFFWSKGFLEMETPNLLRLPGQEPNLSPMRVAIHDERGREYIGYLHTSPEYALKKMLAAGFGNIFSICKVYRDYESFGGSHNPEFTMIEWYRINADMRAIMDDVEELFAAISGFGSINPNFSRLHMKDAWKKYAGVNLDDCLTSGAMFKICKEKGYAPKEEERYEELFYRVFLNEIEPHLGQENPTILHHYPASMAALSRLDTSDTRYAERFEVYVGGIELANCFSELTDPVEQKQRLLKELDERRAAGKDVFDIDEEFVGALKTMPPSAGIALGIDRLVQILTGCKDIDDVISLPESKLFL